MCVHGQGHRGQGDVHVFTVSMFNHIGAIDKHNHNCVMLTLDFEIMNLLHTNFTTQMFTASLQCVGLAHHVHYSGSSSGFGVKE